MITNSIIFVKIIPICVTPDNLYFSYAKKQ
jgi:hypothetical protein